MKRIPALVLTLSLLLSLMPAALAAPQAGPEQSDDLLYTPLDPPDSPGLPPEHEVVVPTSSPDLFVDPAEPPDIPGLPPEHEVVVPTLPPDLSVDPADPPDVPGLPSDSSEDGEVPTPPSDLFVDPAEPPAIPDLPPEHEVVVPTLPPDLSVDPADPPDVPGLPPDSSEDGEVPMPPSDLIVDPAEPPAIPDLPPEPDPPTVPSIPGEAPVIPDGPSAGVTLISTAHTAYLKGTGNGFFSPAGTLTRAEAAVLLDRLLSDRVPVTKHYTDVNAGDWYAQAAEELGTLGVIRPDETTFRPDDLVTRGEFARYIACFFPLRTDEDLFSDVSPDHPDAIAIRSGRAWGWLTGRGDGTFQPDAHLQRCEVAALMNRVLERPGDSGTIAASRPALFLDVRPDAWYYTDLMEACVDHTGATEGTRETWTSFSPADTGLPADFYTDGVHLHQGWSYFYDASRREIVRSGTRNGFSYDASGHFTSGDAEVDRGLRSIILARTDPSTMTKQQMLQELYAYCRDSYRYLKRTNYPFGSTTFMLESARTMLRTGKGNCYCFASVFWYLARWIGYDARVYSGTLEKNPSPHSWVEISFDGVSYIFDPQLEWRWVHDRGRTDYLWHFWMYRDTRNAWHYTKA